MKALNLITPLSFALFLLIGCTEEQKINPPDNSASTLATEGATATKCGCPTCDKGKVTAGSLLVQNESLNFTFSFHGDSQKKEGDIGEFNYVNHKTGVHRHGDVVCLVIINNIAWFVGIEGDNSESPGARAIWRAKDNGEGANDPEDQVSVPLFNQTAQFASSVCNCRPTSTPALINIAEGNIQFHKPLSD